MANARDYDNESKDNQGRKYAYGFDYDVMHPFMVRTFRNFFIAGRALELGSFQGEFTKRLIPFFDHITCVEASPEAAALGREATEGEVAIKEALFEEVKLDGQFENIFMTHVLEHLDNPVSIMKRVNQWLSARGRFFLACPNANAPSRQIAVKMGLISHNAAVTEPEKKHGHQITYSLDTLERDAIASGLKVVHRGGIFFKALANFQWDQLLKTDIVSPEYLEGCYLLGQQYPDLCSSIFLVCEKGDTKA